MKINREILDKLTAPGLDKLTVDVHRARAVVFDADKLGDAKKLNEARKRLAEAEAALNEARAAHQGLIALVNLAAGLAHAGRVKDAENLLSAACGQEAEAPAEAKDKTPAAPPKAQVNGDGTETAVVTVLEARAGASQGTIRAFCETPGGRHAVYGKNGVGQTLAGAVGKQVRIKYRRGDKGLIALAAELMG